MTTVRIERKPDGTTGAITVVEVIMGTIFDALVADGKVREECRSDYLMHADRFVHGPSGDLINATTGASLNAYTQDLLSTRLHWAPVAFTDDEAEAFESPTLASLRKYLAKHGPEKYEYEKARWGTNEKPINARGDLRPGTRPVNATDNTVKNKNIDPRLSTAAIEHDNNPFTRLRRPDGSLDPKIQDRVTGMIVAMGTKRVCDIARSAVSADAPFGRSISGVPLTK